MTSMTIVVALLIYGLAVIATLVWAIHEASATGGAIVPDELKEATLPMMDGIEKVNQRNWLVSML